MSSRNLVTAVMSDIASAFGVPGGQTISELMNAHARRKMTSARDLLLEEMRTAGVSAIDAAEQDEFVSALWRYSRAAIEGAACSNLRLLARALTGLMNEQPVYAERFKRYADILSGLTSEEIFVLANLHLACASLKARGTFHANAAKDELVSRLQKTSFSIDYLDGVLNALTRTGLVAAGSATWDDLGGWKTTPLMDEVAALTGIHDMAVKDTA